MRGRPNPLVGHDAAYGRAGEPASAPQRVEAAHDRSTVPPLDRRRLRVHRDVERAVADTERHQREHERDRVRGERRQEQRRAEYRRGNALDLC